MSDDRTDQPDSGEQLRVLAESERRQAEQNRARAEEARTRREEQREHLEAARQEQETRRRVAEEARAAAEGTRHVTIASLGETADAISACLAQMQFLEEARQTLRHLASEKRDDVE